MIRTCLVSPRRPLLALLVTVVGCQAGRSRSVQSPPPVAPPTATMELSAVPPSGGLNLIKNGDFEEGVLSPWLPAVSSPARGEVQVKDGHACIKIQASGIYPYDILLRQRPIAIKRHRQYTLRLSARATAAARLRAQIVLVGSPPRELWSALVDVGPSEQAWSARVKITEPTNADAEFVIHSGGALQSTAPLEICLDNIALEDPEQTATVTSSIPKIRVDQAGYVPKFTKFAVVKSTSGTPLHWTLVDEKGATKSGGETRVIGEDKDAGELVHQIDFSKFRGSGHAFRLRVGNDESDPFDISRDTFKQLKYDALAFFYQQRSGTEIQMPYAGSPALTHGAGHVRDKSTRCAPNTNCSYMLDVSGGWYDAGDHGKYVVNAGISVWTLLNWYERTKRLGSSLGDFSDGKLMIPERENRQPDLLDEVRWELDFMMKMQVPQGQPLGGMVHHKVHSERWTAIPTAPDKDTVPRFLRPPSTAATLNLAAVGAQCARIYREVAPEFANRCLSSAERAWKAAESHPNVYAPGDDREGGGPYGDTDVSDEMYWAAAELFVTTGYPQYLKAIKQSAHYLKVPTQAGGGLSAFSWANVAGCGTISLVIADGKLPSDEVGLAKRNLVAAAKRFSDVSHHNGYKVPFASAGGRYPWGSNSFILNNGIVLGLAYDLTKQPAFLEGALDSLDYILGRNALAKSYVSSYGTRALQNPHHRFWAHQSNPALPSPPPGVVSGGPNSGIEDPAAQGAGLGGCAPQKCYLDDIESWSTNEVAINWNAPLAWLAAFLDEQAHKP